MLPGVNVNAVHVLPPSSEYFGVIVTLAATRSLLSLYLYKPYGKLIQMSTACVFWSSVISSGSSVPSSILYCFTTSRFMTFDTCFVLHFVSVENAAPSCLISSCPSANSPLSIVYTPDCGVVPENVLIIISSVASLSKTMSLKPPSSIL